VTSTLPPRAHRAALRRIGRSVGGHIGREQQDSCHLSAERENWDTTCRTGRALSNALSGLPAEVYYQMLGSSGLRISPLILGSTMFGELMHDEDARPVVQRALDLGVNTIDMGNIYGGGRAEETVGRLIKGVRDRVVLCTKVGFRVGDGPEDHARVAARTHDEFVRWQAGISPNDHGLSRGHIMRAVEGSLRRLGTDYIDLYQVHRFDPAVPILETLSTLNDLVHSGKVRYIGCSSWAGWQLADALAVSDRRNLERFCSVQLSYSVLRRSMEQEAFPACVAHGVGVIAFQVLGGGVLSGQHGDGFVAGTVLASRPQYQAQFGDSRGLAAATRLRDIGVQLGKAPVELALGAVLANPAVTAATVGVQHPEEFDALAAAVDNPLSAEELRLVHEAVDG
jgi:1-deoxyxylulose-5-phosphate synthase